MERSPRRERVFLRKTFDDHPELYDRVRPAPPAELLDDLVTLAGLPVGARLLEIGCGTGQATAALAVRGFEIVAIELGQRLAEVTRRKLAHLPHVFVVCASFEDWSAHAETQFDAVVAFNSFHWLDPELRFVRSAALLYPGGALAVVGSRYVEHDDADPLWLALQEDYEAVTGAPEPRLHVDAARDRSDEFLACGHFAGVAKRDYLWQLEFDADEYVALLQTTSWHRTLDDDVRRRLFERIHRRIDSSAEARIRPTMAAVLYVARRWTSSESG